MNTRSTGPCSTILPWFITQTRSAILRTMPRSWVMNSIDMPSRCCVSLSSFRICACTVTSSAVVGSSAIKQVRLVRQRHGDHHALALAAGELMRIAAQPPRRIGNADLVEQFEDAGARGLPL